MTTQQTNRATAARSTRRSGLLLSLALGTALAALVATAGTATRADAAQPASNARIVFTSDRTTGAGVNNPTADYEVFRMNPDGSGVRQLTFNTVDDYEPTLSRDGTRVAYSSYGIQTSNPEGDHEIYVMNAPDGSARKNLTDNGLGVYDSSPDFSPNGGRIAYQSTGKQTSNPEGDAEVYRVNTLDGKIQINLTDNGADVYDSVPDFSPDGKAFVYESEGVQASNPEGDHEVYRANTLDGMGQTNLTSNGDLVDDSQPDFSPNGKMVAYTSQGKQTSNPQGDSDVYRMSAPNGTGKKNLSNNGIGVSDFAAVFSFDGTKVLYESGGEQPSNREGDREIYRANASDGTDRKNLSNNRVAVDGALPDWPA